SSPSARPEPPGARRATSSMSRIAYLPSLLCLRYICCQLQKPREWGANRRGEQGMDIIVFWQTQCAPYLKAKLGRSERGAALVEYALLLALIAVVCIVALTTLGTQAKNKFSTVGQSIAAAG